LGKKRNLFVLGKRKKNMKVSALIAKSPVFCGPDTNLGAAAEIMWKSNCGFLPVLSPEQKVVGVLTDRDMCIAMATRNQLPGEITAQQVSSGTVYSCQLEDDISTALATMSEKGIRRLAVLDATGALAGVLSADDIVLQADSKNSLSSESVIRSLKKLYNSQLHAAKAKAASA
jgi:CBS domain-containing protein